MVILTPAGRTETAFTAERHKFKITAVRTTEHSTALGSVAARDHAVDVFHDRGPGMKEILDLFVVINKNGLEDVFVMHKNILQ